ncbi:unnamed protein product [Arctogadus glacialis]
MLCLSPSDLWCTGWGWWTALLGGCLPEGLAGQDFPARTPHGPKKGRPGSHEERSPWTGRTGPRGPAGPPPERKTKEKKRKKNKSQRSNLHQAKKKRGVHATPKPGRDAPTDPQGPRGHPAPDDTRERKRGKEEKKKVKKESSPLPETPRTTPPEEDAPHPARGAYKWDPDNFDDIDPFNSGGAKIANPRVGPEGTGVDETRRRRRQEKEEATPPRPAALPRRGGPGPRAESRSVAPRGPQAAAAAEASAVRLEFDYSEENGEGAECGFPPPKKLGKKPGPRCP